ncbi:MAG: hypothetical protein ACQEWG_11215 [Bacteroidota bacterium]
MRRLCIYPSDVEIITGRSKNYSRKIIRNIKKSYNKDKHQFVSVEEFCKYTGLLPETVYAGIK